MSLVDKCVLLFLLAGHVLVPLVFLIIIFFMKRKNSKGNSTLFANAAMFGSIATVILNVIALIITTAGLNKQRVEENKQPLMWLYVIIAAYVLVVPGRFFIGIFH